MSLRSFIRPRRRRLKARRSKLSAISGFTRKGRRCALPSGESTIIAKTPDGRPTKLTIAPQNSLTNVKVAIGPIHVGDQELSRDLLRRIALNFGTVMRAYTPVDTTIPKRINASRFTPQAPGPKVEELQGEGLRPNENRDKAAGEEPVQPDQEAVPGTNLPGILQVPMPGVQPNPNLPYVPFPIPGINQDAP